MRTRTSAIVVEVGLFVVGCGGTDGEQPTTPTVTAAPQTEAPEGTLDATTTASPATTTQPDGERGALSQPLPVGTTVQVGDWSIRVASVTADGTDLVMGANEFNDPPDEDEQFFLAEIEATYGGDTSSTFWVDMTLKPVGASNVAYESFDAYCGVIPDHVGGDIKTSSFSMNRPMAEYAIRLAHHATAQVHDHRRFGAERSGETSAHLLCAAATNPAGPGLAPRSSPSAPE